VRIAYNWQTKVSKGFAYVVYKQNSAAKAALAKMNGK
jgi:RNA recognition motif-containing protein